MSEPTVRARLDRSGHQVVEITVRGGYRPSAILARAGVPLRLVFRRDDDDVCSERVVFSAPRLDRRLVPTGTTTIDLPAQRPGEVRFTCGMGRYRGHIELVDERPPSIVARLRLDASRLETATVSAARPRWLLPGLAAGFIVSALVVAGVLSLSTVLYVGLFGGMLLMHLGGHGGHGGHGTHGAQSGHDGDTEPDGDELMNPSSDVQVHPSGSSHELGDRALINGRRNETDDHDQRSHGCH